MAGKSKPTKPGGKPRDAGEPAGGSGTSKGGEHDRCDLIIDADLEGVRAAALSDTSKGDQLAVELDLSTPPFIAAVCTEADGTVLRSPAGIVPLNQLRTCLQNGIDYIVPVTSVGTCQVVGGCA